MTAPQPRYPGRAPIDAYGNGGFRFADDEPSRLDPVPAERHLCLVAGEPGRDRRGRASRPRWPKRARSACCCSAPAGANSCRAPRCARAFDAAGIALETMDTGAACRTYNVLLAEGRPVGAALLAVD